MYGYLACFVGHTLRLMFELWQWVLLRRVLKSIEIGHDKTSFTFDVVEFEAVRSTLFHINTIQFLGFLSAPLAGFPACTSSGVDTAPSVIFWRLVSMRRERLNGANSTELPV